MWIWWLWLLSWCGEFAPPVGGVGWGGESAPHSCWCGESSCRSMFVKTAKREIPVDKP